MGTIELEDVILACQRVIDSAHARQLRAIASLAAESGSIFDTQQVALLMRWSDRRAADRLALATRVVDVLPASLDALESGAIDLCKLESISDLTLGLPPEQAREVESRALLKAPEQTGANLRQYVRRQVVKVDPQAAAERAKAKKADRHAALVSEEDDMAKAYVYFSAELAVAVKDRIDRLARQAKVPGDTRTMDQRRADVVCDTVAFPDGPTSPCNCGLTCRRHHRLKQHPDWNLAQPTPGTFVLTTPTGRTYTREPEPVYPA